MLAIINNLRKRNYVGLKTAQKSRLQNLNNLKNLNRVSKRSEKKTERVAASCQHKRRYFFVPLAN
jgi:hypothetical protein